MKRSTGVAAIVMALAGAAFAAPPGARVASVDRAPAVLEPAGVVAKYEQIRGRIADFVADAVAPDAIAWVGDLAIALRAHFIDATGGGRDWLIRVAAPFAPIPPDLTCLAAYPVPDRTSSGYGWRDDPINHRDQFHAGADISAPRGTSVHAAGDGEVIFAGRQHGYGNLIMVDHGRGIVTRYAHLSKILVAKGDVVMAAQEIGKVGATGRATGPHLHFEVRLDGRPVAPQLAMQVAELERTTPDVARLAALALAPDVQSHWINEQDPPRAHSSKHHDAPKGSRPERRGRTPRSHLNS